MESVADSTETSKPTYGADEANDELAERPLLSARTAFNQLTSTTAIEQFKQRMAEDDLQPHPSDRLAQLERAVDEAGAEYRRIVDDPAATESEVTNARQAASTAFAQYRLQKRPLERRPTFLDDRHYSLQEHNQLIFQSTDERVHDLLASIEADHPTQPPENMFMDNRAFQALKDTTVGVRLNAEDRPVSVAVREIIAATTMQSWQGGRPFEFQSRQTGDNVASADVIKDYASRETDIPALDYIEGVVRPDGSIWYVTTNEHRTAAAKMRGQERIQVKNLTLYKEREA